jgi:hypothetical protein
MLMTGGWAGIVAMVEVLRDVKEPRSRMVLAARLKKVAT